MASTYSFFAEPIIMASRLCLTRSCHAAKIVRRPYATRIREQAIASAMWEHCHQRVLAQVHEALPQVHTQPLVLKGTALAYGAYQKPWLRMRADTDIFIPSLKRQRVHDVFCRLGFEPSLGLGGELIFYQRSYTRTVLGSPGHSIDLHWRITNSEFLSHLFSYEELLSRAIRLPNLCDGAMGLGLADALLFACLHRQMHIQTPYYVDGVAYYSASRLIWIYDIHLISNLLSAVEWEEVVRLSTQKGLRSVCLDGVRAARDCFHTHCPQIVLEALEAAPADEPAAHYLRSSKFQQHSLDFGALKGVPRKFQFFRELIFPSAAYMHGKYPQARPSWLPLLYARRGLGGVAKSFGPKRQAA